jgi:hypothetical protein
MQAEGKVVLAVFHDGCFHHFLSLASLFCSWHYVHDQLQSGLNLVHLQRFTRDPHCILSCLIALWRCGRERENCVRREKESD